MRKDWSMRSPRNLARLRSARRVSVFIFRGLTGIFMCRLCWKDFWGRGNGWQLGWEKLEVGHIVERKKLLRAPTGDWAEGHGRGRRARGRRGSAAGGVSDAESCVSGG